MADLKYMSECSFIQHYRIEFDVPDDELQEFDGEISDWWEAVGEDRIGSWPDGQFVLTEDNHPGWQQVGGDIGEGPHCEPVVEDPNRTYDITREGPYNPEYVEPVGILIPRHCYQMVKDLLDAHAEEFPELWEDSE